MSGCCGAGVFLHCEEATYEPSDERIHRLLHLPEEGDMEHDNTQFTHALNC